MMRDFFGTSNVFRESDDIMRVSMQSASATVTLPTFEVTCLSAKTCSLFDVDLDNRHAPSERPCWHRQAPPHSD